MQRWRKINCPSMPHSLTHYADLLALEQWQRLTTSQGCNMNVTAVRSVDGSTSIVYGDIDFLRRISPAHIEVDATFAVCPKRPKLLQLLTIMARISNCNFPIVWALMERKTYHAYVSVLEHFSTVLAPHIRPTSFMTDFEISLASALQTVFPEAVAHRCYFHYCQALMKRASDEGIQNRIRNCEDIGIVFRKLMALPLLPANDIITAFEWILENTPLEIAIHFTRFFQYINTYWLNTVRPQVLTVFGLDCKTNNAIESYHRVLKVRMGERPSIWQFTEALCRLQSVVRCSVASMENGLAINRPPKESEIVKKRILRRSWDLYQQGLLDIPRFLACASTFLRVFKLGIRMANENEVNHFANRVINEQNADRIQALLEERLDEIYVLRRPVDGGGEEIVILPGLHFRMCQLCGTKSENTISLPCCHWIGCIICAAQLMLFARRHHVDIRCSICAQVIEGFRKIILE